jgi:hypothetical protein
MWNAHPKPKLKDLSIYICNYGIFLWNVLSPIIILNVLDASNIEMIDQWSVKSIFFTLECIKW